TVTPNQTPADAEDYWARNVRDPVRFSEGMTKLAAAGCRLFLEIGPSGTLLAMGRTCVDANGTTWIPSQHSEGHGRSRALAALGRLYVAGVSPNWQELYSSAAPQKIDLPTYPFNRRKYWMQQVEKPLVHGRQ